MFAFQDSGTSAHQLENTVGLFYIILCGIVLSLIIAVIEFLYKSKVEAKHKQVIAKCTETGIHLLLNLHVVVDDVVASSDVSSMLLCLGIITVLLLPVVPSVVIFRPDQSNSCNQYLLPVAKSITIKHFMLLSFTISHF